MANRTNFNKFRLKLISDITIIPELFQGSHIPSLNGFRTISILIVLLGHCSSDLTSDFGKRKAILGPLGVYIFFVISGFLITTLLLKEKAKTGDISLTSFYKRRFFRIIPLAFLYPIVLFILNNPLHLQISGAAFITPLLFLVNIPFFNRSKYFGHYWSLSVEEQFYLIFPFILKLNFRLYLNFLFTLLILLVLLRQFDFIEIRSAYPHLYNFQRIKELVNFFDGIIIGSLLSILGFKGMLPLSFFRKFKTLINIITPALVLLLYFNIIFINIGLQSVIISMLIGVILITNIQQSNDLSFKLLNNKIVSYIGTMSFSIYIWQQLFTTMVPSPLKGYYKYGENIWVNLVLLFIISYISFNYYEKLFFKLKSRKFTFKSKKVTLDIQNNI